MCAGLLPVASIGANDVARTPVDWRFKDDSVFAARDGKLFACKSRNTSRRDDEIDVSRNDVRESGFDAETHGRCTQFTRPGASRVSTTTPSTKSTR